jgi:hypothetical protein
MEPHQGIRGLGRVMVEVGARWAGSRLGDCGCWALFDGLDLSCMIIVKGILFTTCFYYVEAGCLLRSFISLLEIESCSERGRRGNIIAEFDNERKLSSFQIG